MEEALTTNDVLLSKMDNNAFLEIRALATEFAFFIAFVEPLVQVVSLNGPISGIWYFVDALMAYRNATAQLPTTPLDITVSARGVASVARDIGQVNDQTGALDLRQVLQEVSKFFDDLAAGSDTELAMMPATQRPVDGIIESVAMFENIMNVLILSNLGELAHRFIAAFYQTLIDWAFETRILQR